MVTIRFKMIIYSGENGSFLFPIISTEVLQINLLGWLVSYDHLKNNHFKKGTNYDFQAWVTHSTLELPCDINPM